MPLPFPDVPGVAHRYVTAGGLRIHLAEAGPPDAPPLLMLHGWPQHWYMWRHQIPPLAERYRVICPDLRGFGWSDAPPGRYDKETLATDLLNLLDELQLDRVRLAGHDWGGWAGFLACARAPERFERYLALNIATPWGRPSPRMVAATWRFWYQAVIATPGLGAAIVRRRRLVDRMIRGTSPHPEAWSDADIAAYAAPLREPARTRASVRLYRTFLTREFPRVAAGRYNRTPLRVPTLLLFGTADFAIPIAFAEGAEDHADDFTLEPVPGVGHFIAEEEPDLVTRRALEFFEAPLDAPPL